MIYCLWQYHRLIGILLRGDCSYALHLLAQPAVTVDLTPLIYYPPAMPPGVRTPEQLLVLVFAPFEADVFHGNLPPSPLLPIVGRRWPGG